MYNRRPINAKYKTYDKIYFIAPNPEEINNDIKKINDLFKDHTDFIKDISSYEMTDKTKTDKKTDFISIKMKTTNLNEDILVEPLRVLAFAVALELLPGQVWVAEGLGR